MTKQSSLILGLVAMPIIPAATLLYVYPRSIGTSGEPVKVPGAPLDVQPTATPVVGALPKTSPSP